MIIKTKDEEVYEFETSPDNGDTDRCEYIHRVSLHPSIRIGGASLGRCINKALPGMRFCYIHSTREAMAHMIKTLSRKD